jgi:hypothetical protein
LAPSTTAASGDLGRDTLERDEQFIAAVPARYSR